MGIFIIGSLAGAIFGVFVMSVLAARGYDRGFEDALTATRVVAHARATLEREPLADVPADAARQTTEP